MIQVPVMYPWSFLKSLGVSCTLALGCLGTTALAQTSGSPALPDLEPAAPAPFGDMEASPTVSPNQADPGEVNAPEPQALDPQTPANNSGSIIAPSESPEPPQTQGLDQASDYPIPTATDPNAQAADTVAVDAITFGEQLEGLWDNQGPTLPQTPGEVQIQRTRSLSLEDAIVLGRSNNKTLQIQALQVERQRAALRQQQAQLYPTLSLNSTLQRTQTATNVDVQGAITDSDSEQGQTSLNGNFQLSYTLVDFSRRSTLNAAEGLVQQAELQLQQTQSELDRDVSLDYYTLQEADEQVRIYEQSVRAAERSLQDAQALEQAGVGTRFASLQAEVQLSNERQNLVNAQSQQLQARRQLAQRLSLPQDAEIVAQDPVTKAGSWDLNLAESIFMAYGGRPELRRRLVERQINEFQRKAQLGSLLPTLGLFSRYDLTQSFTGTTQDAIRGRSTTDQSSLTNQYQVGVNFQWQFFDGGSAKAAARQEEVDIQVSDLQFQDDRNLIRQEVENAFYEVQANLQNIDTASDGVDQAQEALRLARLRFQAGVGTQIDVINAERDLTQSEGNRATAILGYNRALAQLKQAVSYREPTPDMAGATTP